MRPVLILGASGRLGRVMRARRDIFERSGLHPQFQYRGATGRPDDVIWDGNDTDALLRAVGPVEGIICNIGAVRGETEADFDALNVDLTQRLCYGAKAAGVRAFIAFSTAAVYGRAEGPQGEDAMIAPVSPYGRSKARMEQALVDAAEGSDCKLAVVRLGNLLGSDALIGPLLDGAQNRDVVLDRFPDGRTPVRSYVGPDDFVAAIAGLMKRMLEQGEDLGRVNLAASPPVEMADLLRAWQRQRDSAFAWAEKPAPEAAIPVVELTTTRLEALLPDLRCDADPDAMMRQLLRTMT